MFSYSVRQWAYTSSEAARVVLRYWNEAGETFFSETGELDPMQRWVWLRAVLRELRADTSCRHERRALAGAWADGARHQAARYRLRIAALVVPACLAGGCAETGAASKPIATACGVARAACAVVETACGVADAAAPASAGGEEP